MSPLLAALAAMLVLGGLGVIAVGIRPAPVLARPARQGPRRGPSRRLSRGYAVLSPRSRLLLVAGFAAGLLVWLVTGWLVAVLVLPVAFAGLPVLLLAPQGDTPIARLEAMEEWTRSLAGVLTVGVGIEQALIATARSTPDAIRPEVLTLVARLRARWGTVDALRAFADDLDDATGDLIAASLLLGATRRGNGLVSVLEGLAATVADDVRIRRAIEADRAKPRTTARWVTMITVGVLVLFSFNGSYIAPYGSGIGQLVLVLLLASYTGALLWLRQMAAGTKLPRFIGAKVAAQQGPA